MLREGGSAADAICAAAFAAFVCELPLCGPAGAGVLISAQRDRGFEVLDFFASAPGLGGGPPAKLDFHDVEVDFGPTTQLFHVGRGAVAVPGTLPGLLRAHAHGGRLPLAEVVRPAVELARDGYTLGSELAFIISILAPIVNLTPAVQAMFGARSGLPAGGTRLDNPALADFLEQLGAQGEAFVAGAFKDALIRETGPSEGGLVTAADLERYEVFERPPLQVPVEDFVLLTNPPPSSGGALVGLGLVLADRIQERLRPFLGASYATEIAGVLAALSATRAEYDERVAKSGAAEDLFDRPHLRALHTTHDAVREERQLGSTTHISVLTAEGAEALTMSNGEGCGHALAEFGIHINNFLGEEDINPGGFHRWPAGQRMTTMMAPSLVTRGGTPVLAIGSGGSNRIRSAIMQAVVNALILGEPIEAAIAGARTHVEGTQLWYEAQGLGPGAAEALASKWPGAVGFDEPNMFFGGVHAACRDGDRFYGAGDPRRGGAVAIV